MLNAIFFNSPIEANAIGHIVAEIFKDGIYYPFFNGKKDLVCIDAGANVGIWSYFAARYSKLIYAIEPSTEHYSVLQECLRYNKIEDKVKTFQFALSIKDDEGELTHYSNTTMFSLYANLADNGTGGLAQTGKEPVRLKRLDTFFKEEKIGHVDFLKLDVEGVEYEILGSDSFSNVSDKIDNMIVEVHSYSGRHPQQIVDALNLRGFEVVQIPNQALLFFAHK